MEKCPHCGSAVKNVSESIYFCAFCDMTVTVSNPVEIHFRGAVDHVDAAKSTKHLKWYHTFDLLLLLRFCREERRSTYDLMQTFNRVKTLSQEFGAGFKESYAEYDYWTKKARIMESLVKERIGYIPRAVTIELLETFYGIIRIRKQFPFRNMLKGSKLPLRCIIYLYSIHEY